MFKDLLVIFLCIALIGLYVKFKQASFYTISRMESRGIVNFRFLI